jgi:hypothetical protein
LTYRDALNAAVISFPAPLGQSFYRLVVSTRVRDAAGNAFTTNMLSRFAVLASGPEGDDDGDFATNELELIYGTNPFLADTDGDGWLDGAEIDNETNPLDLNSRPKFTLVARPPIEVSLPSAESFGSAGAPVFVARPPVEVSLPSAETLGTSGAPVFLARPPVSVLIGTNNPPPSP